MATTSGEGQAGGRLYNVVYPGLVKASGEAKALRSLGGIPRLRHDLDEGRGLEMRPAGASVYHRPQFSHRAVEKDNAFSIVISAKRRRRRRPDGEWEYAPSEARVLGLLAAQHEFKAFADFQYLPLRTRDRDGNVLEVPEDVTDECFPTSLALAQDWLDNQAPTTDADLLDLMAPPLVMSRVSQPSPYLLARPVKHRDEAILAKQGAEAGTSCRKERPSLAHFVQGSEPEFPREPMEGAVTYAEERIKNLEVHRRLRELFEERPLWTRNAIVYHTKLGAAPLKTLLGKFAFYISSGPWGRAWCRFGYDPRKNPAAVAYQTVMISFKHRDSIQIRHRLRLGPSGALAAPHRTSASAASAEASEEASWVYRPGRVPTFRQCFFALVDIHLPIAAAHLQPSAAARAAGVAHPTQGFLPKGVVEEIRAAVTADVEATEAAGAVDAPHMADIPIPDLQPQAEPSDEDADA